MNRIIFGNACYLLDNLIRIRKRNWNTPLPNGKSWRQPYVASLSGVDQSGQFNRSFISRQDRVLNGIDALEWYIDSNIDMIEFGWVYDNVDSHDANTHYLKRINGQWKEISKDEMIASIGGK